MVSKRCAMLGLIIVGVQERVGRIEALVMYHHHQNLVRSRRQRTATQVSATVASWNDIESLLGDVYTEPNPVSIDSALDPSQPTLSTSRPTLFRERHGWCPYSERVWLALELLHIEYDTIRIDNTGGPRPAYFAGQTPQLQWPVDENDKSLARPPPRRQGESRDLVAELDRRYNDKKWLSDDDSVNDAMDQFSKLFPSKARPSSRAAFLFQYNGEPLWKSVLETTLRGVDALISQSDDDGPYLCGSTFTVADIHYLPFLERYRYQLPCLHEGLDPYDAAQYPSLTRWYDAVDWIPEYACRIKGDASSWVKVLTMHGYGNAGVPMDMSDRMERIMTSPTYAEKVDRELWKEYAMDRKNVASTPHAQAALVMTKNRDAIVADAASRLSKDAQWVDDALRELSHQLILRGEDDSAHPGRAREPGEISRAGLEVAQFLCDRMCVPRDMGAMPAACLRQIVVTGYE